MGVDPPARIAFIRGDPLEILLGCSGSWGLSREEALRYKTVGLFFLWMGLWTGTIWAGQAEVIERVGYGEINWSRGMILAKGSGVPPKEAKNIAQARLMSERTALADARRNLMEVLIGVQVDSVSDVENYLVKNDQIRLSAAAFIQGSTEVKDRRRYLPDGGIEVTVAVNLRGDFFLWLFSPPKELPGSQPPVPGKPASQLPPISSGKKAEPPPEQPQVRVEEKLVLEAKALPPFTGLVIDARGLNMRAALIPKVFDESGQELYQGQYVPPEKAAQNGLALYAKDLNAAQTNPRVGKKPLTVKGFEVNPDRPSEIVLTAEDSKRVAPFAQKGTFLEECKVMIVLD